MSSYFIYKSWIYLLGYVLGDVKNNIYIMKNDIRRKWSFIRRFKEYKIC